MRLLNVETLKLEFFETHLAPPYAILSHTWGKDEVTFQELLAHTEANSPESRGWAKVKGACKKAASSAFGLQWIWIDTCCIDKTSSSELSEAINSMFSWYSHSTMCYAFLDDFHAPIASDGEPYQASLIDLCKLRWFTRGWTLQELIAPTKVEFCDLNWHTFGSKASLTPVISAITAIDGKVLIDPKSLSAFGIAQRLSWAADRETTRLEDQAYCLMGIVDVNMPLLYGEGRKAFIRLQEEIIKNSADMSIFAWTQTLESYELDRNNGALATDPSAFKSCGDVIPFITDEGTYEITNQGLRIQARLARKSWRYEKCLMILHCWGADRDRALAIRLARVYGSENKYYRIDATTTPLLVPEIEARKSKLETFFIQKSGKHDHATRAFRHCVSLLEYPTDLITLQGPVRVRQLGNDQLRSAKWNDMKKKGTFDSADGSCMLVLIFELRNPVRTRSKYLVVTVQAMLHSGKEADSICFYTGLDHPDSELVLPGMADSGTLTLNKESAPTLARKPDILLKAELSRLVMFDEICCTIRLSAQIANSHLYSE
jgi:hypothetical protein